MEIDRDRVKARWTTIRDKKTGCDLSLTPESVARYLSIPESKIVKERILESLTQLANYYRVDGFRSYEPPNTGDLATCEGLEAFLVPAVEDALSFSEFLDGYKNREPFAESIFRDIDKQLHNWEKGIFQGEPYAGQKEIEDALDSVFLGKIKRVNITEAAAMACRVLIHLLTLKLNRPTEEKSFRELIGARFEAKRLFSALKAAMEFLVESFQKGEGNTTEERIANSQYEGLPGSGWSWTNWDKLPPLLFFTAAAVDAFAELDLYLIRAGSELENGTDDQKKLHKFYSDNVQTLDNLQLCVEMARHWVRNSVLPRLCKGFGEYTDKAHKPVYETESYSAYQEDISRAKLSQPPMGFYNNLYGLQILLWSWGDRDEDGDGLDLESKEMINRALAQLVYNYDAIPIVKEVLGVIGYTFNLPTESPAAKFETKQTFTYFDSGFLPLLTRLLVLFVVYGVGDRNLLEPVIRTLYIELLQNRNRTKIETSNLWSAKGVEIFSTMRALQALTFYHAYARGKEKAEHRVFGPVETSAVASEFVTFENTTGFPLIFKAAFADGPRPPEPEEPRDEDSTPLETPALPDKFADFCIAKNCKPYMGYSTMLPEGEVLFDEMRSAGQQILYDCKEHKIRDGAAATLVLNSIVRLMSDNNTEKDMRIRRFELDLLREQHKQLLGTTPE